MAQLKSTNIIGNLSVTDSILASEIQKIGGTANEVLMADGSVRTDFITEVSVENINSTVGWNTTTTIATVDGKEIKINMPAEPAVSVDGKTIQKVDDTISVKDSGITTGKIADGAVTTEKLGSDVDFGVTSISLDSGSKNGTVKLTVNDLTTDNIEVTGLKSAAYATIEFLNATAKGYADAVEQKLPTSANYGVLTVAKGDDTITIGGTTQNPTIKVTPNTFDAYGAAASVQKILGDYEEAHASDYTNAKIDELVQGAKNYADTNDANTAHTHQNGKGIKVDNSGGISGKVKADLNIAFELIDKTIKLYDKDDSSKAAIATLDASEFIVDGMLASVTADQDNNKLVFEWNTDAGVTKTEIPLSSIADIYTGKTGDEVNVSVSNTNEISASLNTNIATKIDHGETAYGWSNHASAGYAANADLTNIINGTTTVAKATDADKLGGQLPSYYATAASINAIPDTIDSKITAYNTSKKFGDIITHNAAEFATSAQGARADSALQSVKVLGATLTNASNELTVNAAKIALGLGGAAAKAADYYQVADADLTAIAELTDTSGLLRKTAANTWALDTNTYLTTTDTAANSFKLGGVAAASYATQEWVGENYTNNTGTVTSIGMTVPTGLSISPATITSSGTFAITYASGYAIPTTAKQGNWDTAFGWGDHKEAGYIKSYTDTKNTAGTTNNSSKLYLIGATEQSANPQTYSNSKVYTTDGTLTTTKTQIGGGAVTMEYDITKKALKFKFS